MRSDKRGSLKGYFRRPGAKVAVVGVVVLLLAGLITRPIVTDSRAFVNIPPWPSEKESAKPLYSGNTLGQSFESPFDGLSGVGVALANHGGQPLEGEVVLHLREASNASSDLRTAVLPASSLSGESQYYMFAFSRIPDSAGRRYYVALEAPLATESAHPLVRYEIEGLGYPGGTMHLENDRPAYGDVAFSLVFTKAPLNVATGWSAQLIASTRRYLQDHPISFSQFTTRSFAISFVIAVGLALGAYRVPARRRWLFYGGLVLFGSLVFFHTTVDDAFISFRYARNLAAGNGLVFNPGEWVEGFSNPLWVFILAWANLVGLNIVFVAKVLGGALALGTLYMTYRLAQLVLPAAALGSHAYLLVLAASIPFISWAVSGFEPPLYTFLLTAASAVFIWEGSASRGFPRSSVLFGLVALTRPEGAMFGLLAGCFVMYRFLRGSLPFRRLVLWASAFSAFFLPYIAFRLAYYGKLVPNTAIAKATVDWDARGGLDYLAKWFGQEPGLALLAALGAAALLVRRRTEATMLLLGAVVAEAGFIMYARGDWMPLSRFVVPVVPLLVVLLQAGLSGASSLLQRLARAAKWSPGHAPAVLLLALAIAPELNSAVPNLRMLSWKGVLLPSGVMGLCFRTTVASTPVINYDDLGVFPYYSDLPIVDVHGLIEEDIALFNRDNPPGDLPEQRLARSYLILKHDPSYIVTTLFPTEPVVDFSRWRDTVARMVLPPEARFEFVGGYTILPRGGLAPLGRFMLVYRKAELPEDPAVARCVDEAAAVFDADFAAWERNPRLLGVPLPKPWDEIVFLAKRSYALYAREPK